MDSIKVQLKEMGFHETKIKRAIESCPEAQTLEQVMEWLIAHEDELNKEIPNPAVKADHVADETKPSEIPLASAAQDDAQAGGPEETASNMAARKKITVEEAQKLIRERQAKRVEEDRKKAIEEEKRRRVVGKKIAETRQELEDQERLRIALQIKKEKQEREQHRKMILEQIARDREAIKQRNSSASSSTAPGNSPASNNKVASGPVAKATATDCKLALRFPDGTSAVQIFSPQEQLSAVRLFAQMKQHKPEAQLEFIAPPNRKLTESMMDQTLESLELCPASRLEVRFKQSQLSYAD